MLIFLRKNYKKFFIIFSAFILFYSVFIVHVHDVNASAIYTPSDDDNFDLRYINGNKHIAISFNDLIPGGYGIIDLPTTTSYFFGSEPLEFSISSDIFSLPIQQGFLATDVGYDTTSFSYDNSLGAFSILIDSYLYSPGNLTEGLELYIYADMPSNLDTIYFSVEFSYYVYDSSTFSFSSVPYQFTGSLSGVEVILAPFQTFVSSLSLNYDYYYFTDIKLGFSADFADSSNYSILSTTSLDSNYFTFDNFVDLNDFSLGASSEAINNAYNNGYDIGFSNGVDSVNTQEFYNQGYTNASQDFLKFENLIFGVMNGFTNTISELFDFQIFGISVFGLIGGLVAIAFGVGIIILIIKVIKIFT